MFTLRKKPDSDFVWHDYIRTTIKLRRDARRQRVIEARQAAGQQMQAAGVALAAGSRAAGGALRHGARAGAGALGLGLQSASSFALHRMRAIVRPVADLLARPHVGIPVGVAGAIALGAGIGRWRALGLDREAAATFLIGALLMASLLLVLARAIAWRPPTLPARATAMLAGVALLVAGLALVGSGGGLKRLAAVSHVPLIGGGRTVQGYASAVGADSLRIGSVTVRLSGVEAPEVEQRCGRAGRSWRCSAAAEIALSRLVEGPHVSCTLSGTDDTGHALGRCMAGRKDVAGELVRHGYVFAQDSILARYAGEERAARAARAGMWIGDVERPAAYRAKLWEEARRRAPEGCPIKGQVAGSTRFYVLPWSPGYERARVQTARGERWFCSEQEAVAAGFKAARRG
jgi:endonuclease YncB( thermonuclease family)